MISGKSENDDGKTGRLEHPIDTECDVDFVNESTSKFITFNVDFSVAWDARCGSNQASTAESAI